MSKRAFFYIYHNCKSSLLDINLWYIYMVHTIYGAFFVFLFLFITVVSVEEQLRHSAECLMLCFMEERSIWSWNDMKVE